MDDVISIIFPNQTPYNKVKEIQDSLKDLESVHSADQITPRGLDPTSIMLWVQLISGILASVGTSLSLLKKIQDLIRAKGISNVKIKLPNEIDISIDNTSVEELEKILKIATKK